ncbi:MAG: MFS transporter [Chloroflexi bacterium]|nr:MFS transporter [Chloroflexota bacterium]
MRTFAIILFGQLISMFGSGLTGFALGVWVYQETGSVTQYALISLFTILPTVVLSPFIGALVDRWNRRWVMFMGDAGAGLMSLTIALLFFSGQLTIGAIYVCLMLASVANTFQWTAWAASTALLVPKQQLARANGMIQAAGALTQICAPLLAGVLLELIEMRGILLIDVVSFLFALGTLLIVRFPELAENTKARRAIGQEITEGWRYIRERPGLMGMLLLFASANFTLGLVQVLVPPLVLTFASSTALGTVLSIGGVGALLGSLAISIWGGPRRKVYGVLGGIFVQGAILLLGGFRPSVPLITVATFLFLFCFPIVGSCSQAIWQTKIAPEIQGRVFALRRMVALSASPVAYLLAGPLVDQVFEPLLLPEGALADSVGQVIGVGEGRGIGLLLILLGLGTMLVVIASWLRPQIRLVELRLPDVISDTPKAAEASPSTAGQLPQLDASETLP